MKVSCFRNTVDYLLKKWNETAKIEKARYNLAASSKTKFDDNYKLLHMEKNYKWLSENGKIVKSPEERESIREKNDVFFRKYS